MKKIIKSGFIVLAVAAIAGYGTYSYFSDTETSTGNNFTAGAIDLTVSHESTATDGACTIVNGTSGPIFSCTDVKPGDNGKSMLKFNLASNPAWGCMQVNNVVDSDNTCVDPEIAAESVCQPTGNGELDNHLNLTIWMDDGAGNSSLACNKVRDGSEEVVVSNQPLSNFVLPSGGYVLPIADSTPGALRHSPIPAGDHCIGVEWNVPNDTGNEVQTDKLGGDLVFYVEQSRNNNSFKCSDHFATVTTQQTLTLEDETINPTGPWTPNTGNNIDAKLIWDGDLPTFKYSLNARGLQTSTEYDLIYYADPWPGNHPGKFIGSFNTDGSGNYTGNNDVNLNLDLPDPADANFGTGAKLWIVLASDYDESSNSMTAWQPEKYLFEGNDYIHYNDTDN